MKNRVKAFTIMEVTVAMILAAMVIGITYTAFNIVNQLYSAFNKKNVSMAVLTRLDELLKKDFAGADIVALTQNGIVCKISGQAITYQLDTGFVVRTSTIIDTFKVSTQNITTLFENQPVNAVSPVAEQNRVDELQFIITFQDEKIPYHYHKDYSAANLIERNPNAVN
jgi:type II secretory pathway component PulJ